MTETTRIRWQPGAEAWATAWFGCVGTLDSHLFEILRPGRSDEWTLITTSGTPGIIADSRYGSDPDVLKAEAERWLEEFVSSLGAVFPEDADEVIFDERPTGEAFVALYAPGRRVRFEHPDGGWDGDQQMAAALLTPGEVYTIAWSDVGFSKTRLGLSGVESHGQGFNSVLFEPVDDQVASSPAAQDKEESGNA